MELTAAPKSLSHRCSVSFTVLPMRHSLPLPTRVLQWQSQLHCSSLRGKHNHISFSGSLSHAALSTTPRRSEQMWAADSTAQGSFHPPEPWVSLLQCISHIANVFTVLHTEWLCCASLPLLISSFSSNLYWKQPHIFEYVYNLGLFQQKAVINY